MTKLFINDQPIRTHGKWIMLTDVLAAVGFERHYTTRAARLIDDEHVALLDVYRGKRWHATLEGIAQWADIESRKNQEAKHNLRMWVAEQLYGHEEVWGEVP